MNRPSSASEHNSRTRRQRRRADDGAVAVEFVLLLPTLLVLMFGVIQFGRAYNAKVELTGAVREGARVLALGTDDVETTVLDAAPGLDPTQVSVSTSDDPCTAGEPASVTATYPFEINIPFWGNPTVNIQATGVMRCGG